MAMIFGGRRLFIVGWLSVLLPAAAFAQESAGIIAGVVRDTTGAVMPGVTVEASSPALIEKTVSTVTDAQGVYRIPELRPGVYAITFTLPGFSVLRREGLELTAAFTATVNAELRVGGVEETITVAGASPVVDVQNVRTQNVFSRELLDSLPTSRSVAGFATLTLGAQLNSPSQQNVGGNQSEAASAGGFTVHGGRPGDLKLLLNGMQSNDASFAGATNRNAINPVAAQETVFQIGGMGAEAETGGVHINVIPKEGGNTFTYYLNLNGSSRGMQASNLTDQIRQRGLDSVSKIKKVWDFGGAVGGPILRDKLWFFVASRSWGSQNEAPGNYFNATHGIYIGAPNSGASLYTPDLERKAYTDGYLREWFGARFTLQATDKQKLGVSHNAQDHCDCYRGVDGLLAPEAVVQRIYGPAWVNQVAWTYPVTNRFLLEAGNTWVHRLSNSARPPGVTLSDVAMLETTGWTRDGYVIPAGYQWGAAVSATTNYNPPFKLFSQVNQRIVGSFTTGAHAFKAGVTMMQGWNRDRTELNDPPIRIRLSGGVPIALDEYTELENSQRLKMNLGVFFQDQWTMDRLTLNLGLRYSYYNAFVPAQTIRAPLEGDGLWGASPGRDSLFLAPELGPDGILFDEVKNVPRWSNWTPRLGAAYDLFGNGKTAIKGSIGQYLAFVGLTEIPRFNAPARRLATTARRNWTDSNGNWIVDCDLPNGLAQNLTASGGDICGQVNNLNIGRLVPSQEYASDVLLANRENNWQAAISVQQELFQGIALNAGYFRTWYNNLVVTANQALTAADFDTYCVTAPTDSRLGETSGKQICGLFDVKPGRFGAVNSLITQASNFGDKTEVYDGVDIAVNGRYGRGGIVQGGVSFGRTVLDECDVLDGNPQIANNPYVLGGDPNGFCRQVNSNQTQFKAAGNYPLPWWGLEASATYQNNPGIVINATRAFSRVEIRPSLGRNTNEANTTLPIMQPFSEFGDRISQLDLRLGKRFTFGRFRLRGQFDVYNVTNAAPILAESTDYGTAGATWERPSSILGGRLFKIGGQLEF
jgi:hypothetical protein